MSTRVVLTLAVVGSLFVWSDAYAQSGTRGGVGAQQTQNAIERNSASNFSSRNHVNQILNNSITRDRSIARNIGPSRPPVVGANPKPFANLNRGTAVSPYLALNNSLNPVSDYYNIVRPQLRQRQLDRRMHTQQQAAQRRLGRIASQRPYNPAGDDSSAPTGHDSRFLSLGNYLQYGGYYPQ